eukprot:TRINITY_DN384_c0_g4_i3.p2 TRINITY_DN384_c0_g4~~TRINITY_DN384_c0_g4_i3.p2  ORF type:complete len:132 (+),score=61.34 TRINITY_DN384_c0_g4_i3:73-468(+)
MCIRDRFSNYVSESGTPLRVIRDQIVFGSKLQNKHFIEESLKKRLEEKHENFTQSECQTIFTDLIKGLKLYSEPSEEKIKEAFGSYEFLAPDDIPENIAIEAIMQSMQELQKEVKNVAQSEVVKSQVLLPA